MKSTFDGKLVARKEDLKKNKFNIINHEGPPRRVDADPQFAAARAGKDRGRPWHLLSHLQRDTHKGVSLRYLGNYPHLIPPFIDDADPFDKIELMKKPKPRPDFNRDPGRPYNIVSTKFKGDDEGMQKSIDDAIKQKCEEKYWKTHDFDFIKIKQLDQTKEEKYLEQREEKSKVWGEAQLARYPPILVHSEGQNYNIINNVMGNEERLKAGPLKGQVRANNRIKQTAIQQAAALAGDEAALVASDRRLKRIAYKSWEGPLERGYSLVNNAPHGDAAAVVHLPHPERVPSNWARLSVQLEDPSRPPNKVDLYASGSNFMGTHDGTGMNARRAYTSLPNEVPVRTRDISGAHTPAAYPPRSTMRPLTTLTGGMDYPHSQQSQQSQQGRSLVAPLNMSVVELPVQPPARGSSRVRTGGGLAAM